MNIVDAQVHLGHEGFAETLARMDVLGISAALLSELWPGDKTGRVQPGYELPGGIWRRVNPVAEQAALLHPRRFSYLNQINPRDPELESLITLIKSAPNARALRIMPLQDLENFAAGVYDALFALAQEAALPVFVMLSGKTALLKRSITQFPRLIFIVDHCGVPWNGGDVRTLDEVLELAAHPNVALKWSHAQDHFGAHDYPYDALFPLLRRAINTFGAERVMWASDHTSIKRHSWADLLFYLRDSTLLSTTEKENILGGTVRRLLDWPI